MGRGNQHLALPSWCVMVVCMLCLFGFACGGQQQQQQQQTAAWEPKYDMQEHAFVYIALFTCVQLFIGTLAMSL